MKASLKFRDDQKPLFRAKVPLNILGLPFQSGIAAGESKELSLTLGTLFDSGPSLKVAYRPNDSSNPFSLVLKTGIGSYGSPNSASMTMSAEFNPLELGNPRFFLHFRPQLGDFSIKKTQSSVFNKKFGVGSQNSVGSEDDGSFEAVKSPMSSCGYVMGHGGFPGKSMAGLQLKAPAMGFIENLFSGVEVGAKTVLPVRNGAILNCRWGLRFSEELRQAFGEDVTKDRTAGVSLKKLPLLVLNKIGIEHSADKTLTSKESSQVGWPLNSPGTADLAAAEACFTAKRQLEILQAENGLLKKAMEDLQSEFSAAKLTSLAGAADPSNYGEGDRRGIRQSGGKFNRREPEVHGFAGKAAEGELREEQKKA
ncbi:uncharacterized protein LOC131167697 [Malania oleifera]|uniref:uncharacterized protein LOC131167697 n=1 Tax=Malania oleifera TaxID=397392 RepID=UPI0025ADAE8A|nr:uncharacterized protein LOC131167697 [Malania oleifera]